MLLLLLLNPLAHHQRYIEFNIFASAFGYFADKIAIDARVPLLLLLLCWLSTFFRLFLIIGVLLFLLFENEKKKKKNTQCRTCSI